MKTLITKLSINCNGKKVQFQKSYKWLAVFEFYKLNNRLLQRSVLATKKE